MKRFIIYIIVGIMAVACAEGDRDIVEPASDKITFRTVADMPQTRTALTSEGGKYRAIWKEGDTFKVAQIANGASTLSEGTVATDAERLSVLAQFDVVEASEYTYIFASPTVSISSDATYFELTMPSQQLPPAMDTFDGAADLLISDAETTTAQPDGGSVDFNINRVSAIGKVTVKNLALSEGDSVQSVTFSCGKPVAGRMTNILLSDIVSGLDPLTNGKVIEADTAITTSLAEPQTGDFTYFFSCWPTTLAEGDSYTVMVTTTKGNYIKTATIPSPLTFTSGRMTTFTINMAGVALEVAGEEVDLSSYTDLSAEGTANCYLVQATGRYKFKAVKGNSTEPVGDVGFTYVLWESYGTDIMPLSGNLIASTGYQDGYVYFSTPMSFKNGNSSIAVYDTNGTILWSWHIWSSAEGWNDHVYKNNAGTMMDRNLGATSATPGNVGALGLLYQWGRKDPFMGSSDISISTVAISLGTWKTVSGSQTVDYAIENPMTFIGGVEWCAGTGADDTDYTKRWLESEKTMYDPCPVGYRVPKGGESGFWATALGTSSATSEGTTWDETNKGRHWTLADGTTAWYPAVGNRNYGSGVLSYVGSHGFYWSASPLPSGSSTRNAHYMIFYDGHTTPAGSYSRGHGFSVRCVREGSDSGSSTPDPEPTPDPEVPDTHKIHYTSTDGKVVTPYITDIFGANIVSNTYENGQGVITFDADVTSIGYAAFYRCSSLTSITIPDSVTSIGNYAFQYCSSLTSVTIPDSVTSIGNGAFANCGSLQAFYGKYASSDNRYLVIDGVLNSFAPSGLTSYTIPDSITSIGDYAFYQCSSLISVTIPESVTSIGDYAFENCSSLVSVYCKPTTPPTLGTAVFDGNAADRKIYVPAASVNAYKTANGWNTYADAIVAEEGSSDENRKIYYTSTDGNVVTPDTTYGFGANIVSNTYENGQGVITFDGEVTQIGDNAFYNLETLLGITIPDSVTEIGEYAFRNCKNLATVTIPDGVTLIKYGSFDGCSGLTSATIGSSITSLGDYAFYNCSSLVSVYCKPTIPPTLGNYVFFWNAENRKIYVPAAFVEAYKTANGWNAYADAIVADSDNGDVDLSLYTDLSAEGTANCYLVQAAGKYKFKAVKGNSTESVGAAQSAKVLWETFGTDVTPNVGDLVADAGYKDDYIYFSTPATFSSGNASIAVYDANDTILWSWHIWCSAEGWSDHVYANNAGTMMDRNLGATSATPGNVGALGLMYQWGRKDPFLSSSSISTNTDAASTGTWNAVSEQQTVESACQNPTTFICTSEWCTGDGSGTNTGDLRWKDTEKTAYDPCPVGYRVPKGGEDEFWATSMVTTSWDNTNKGINWTLADGTTAWYPAVGRRSCNSGALGQVGSDGYCWSASPNPSTSRDAYHLFCHNGNVGAAGSSSRGNGTSIRCFREGSDSGSSIPDPEPTPDPEVPDTHKILYTSTDGNAITNFNSNVFGANVVSNTYENGQGVIVFDGEVTKVGSWAFASTATLSTITLPSTVADIEDYAFLYCTNLSAFYGSLATADGRAVVINNKLCAFAPSGLTEYSVPEGVVKIGSTVFESCATLVNVTLPQTLEEIGDSAFYNISTLKGINIPGRVTRIGAAAFRGCSGLETISIPDSVNAIGASAFRDCVGLVKVAIGGGLTSLYEATFENCTSLTNVTLGDSMSSIGLGAFYGCCSLVSIELPVTVTLIDNNVFSDCTSLASVYCLPTIPPSGSKSMFNNNAANRKIYVPAASLDAYKAASGWSAYADAICSDEVDLSQYTDLSAEGTANCYLVKSAGNYKLKAVKGNSTTSVGDAYKASVLWETFGTATTPNIGDLVTNAGYKDGYVYFSTPSTFANGNASIAVHDANNTILWSWHIWCSEEGWSDHVYANNAGTMMDRNLGATSAMSGSVGALGLLYQWGRKDPFLSSSSISAITDAASTGTWNAVSGQQTVDYVTANPTSYVATGGDWCTGDGAEGSNYTKRWMESGKTMYDPCPVGYRVPKGDVDGFWVTALGTSSATSEGTTWDDTNKGRHWTLADGTTAAWYPAVGCRSYDSGLLYNVGENGYCWSASPDPSRTNNAYNLRFYYGGNVSPAISTNRGRGYSVRCVRE